MGVCLNCLNHVFSILQFLRLSPRRFGEPSSRDRCWRILINPKKAQWTCHLTFRELADIILLPLDAPLKLTPQIYMFAQVAEDDSHTLCTSALAHLEKFKEIAPQKKYYDLASNPTHRMRTETVDGALMTLTTNSTIWYLDLILLTNGSMDQCWITLKISCFSSFARLMLVDAFWRVMFSH